MNFLTIVTILFVGADLIAATSIIILPASNDLDLSKMFPEPSIDDALPLRVEFMKLLNESYDVFTNIFKADVPRSAALYRAAEFSNVCFERNFGINDSHFFKKSMQSPYYLGEVKDEAMGWSESETRENSERLQSALDEHVSRIKSLEDFPNSKLPDIAREEQLTLVDILETANGDKDGKMVEAAEEILKLYGINMFYADKQIDNKLVRVLNADIFWGDESFLSKPGFRIGAMRKIVDYRSCILHLKHMTNVLAHDLLKSRQTPKGL